MKMRIQNPLFLGLQIPAIVPSLRVVLYLTLGKRRIFPPTS